MEMDIRYRKDALGAWRWKLDETHPKCETLSKTQFWTMPGTTVPKRGAAMDLGRIRARWVAPLGEV